MKVDGRKNRGKSPRLKWMEDMIKNPPPNECVIWPFTINPSGYGGLFMNGQSYTAHRASLMLYTESNPKGLEAAHGPCHNRACVNPLHLSWKTRTQNQRDRIRDGTSRRRFTDDQVRHIRRSDINDAADDFKTAPSFIRKIKDRKHYEWVSDA